MPDEDGNEPTGHAESPVAGDSGSPAAVALRADRLRRTGDPAEAREMLEQALGVFGPQAELYWSLAALDPAIFDKVDAARGVVGALHDARSLGKSDTTR
jgi:hypothetical protein